MGSELNFMTWLGGSLKSSVEQGACLELGVSGQSGFPQATFNLLTAFGGVVVNVELNV